MDLLSHCYVSERSEAAVTPQLCWRLKKRCTITPQSGRDTCTDHMFMMSSNGSLTHERVTRQRGEARSLVPRRSEVCSSGQATKDLGSSTRRSLRRFKTKNAAVAVTVATAASE